MLDPGPTEVGGAWSGLAWQSEKRSWWGILRGVMWKMVHPSEGPEGLLPSYAAGKERGLEKAASQFWKCQDAWKCQDEELGLLPEGMVGRARQECSDLCCRESPWEA